MRVARVEHLSNARISGTVFCGGGALTLYEAVYERYQHPTDLQAFIDALAQVLPAGCCPNLDCVEHAFRPERERGRRVSDLVFLSFHQCAGQRASKKQDLNIPLDLSSF